MRPPPLRPPFPYYGGKQRLAAWIVDILPPHRVYLEPFFGSGAVFFAKPAATHEILNDVDDRVVTFFRCLRDRPHELARVCALTPHSRTEYERALEDTDDELEAARRFWVRVNQSFGKTGRSATGWSITTGRNTSIPRSLNGRLSRFEVCAARLAEATIENRDAVELIERFGTADAVIYADPPYLGATRTSTAVHGDPGDYQHDMTSVEDHVRVAEALRATEATVVLSGYPSGLYEELYAGWDAIDRHVTVASSNAARSGRNGRVERLWTNRPLNNTLFSVSHDAEGADYSPTGEEAPMF